MTSVLQVAAAFALAVALGFGPAYWLLPAPWRRHSLLVAPAAGYALLCLLAITISMNFALPAKTAVWIACGLLLAVSVAAAVRAVRQRDLGAMWSDSRPAAWATLLMAAAMFWPVFVQGTSLFIGTANIDFYQSLAYQETLARFGLGALDPRPAIDYSLEPFFGTFPDPVPAKFGGVMYGLLLQQLLGIEPRTALMAALVAFLLALPAATSLFAKSALQMDDRAAGIAAALVAVSAPVAMSFIHVLVGQNSSLALLPLGLALCYVAVRTRDWRAMLLAFLVLDAVFWMYVAMLPYIAAPVALFAVYDLVRNRRGAVRWLATAIGVLVVGFGLLQLGMMRDTRQLISDMVALLGHANRTVYVDFLTEVSLPHSLGLASYPVTSSVWLAWAPFSLQLPLVGVFVAAAILVLLYWFRTFVLWARRAAPAPRAFGVAVLLVYLAVWIHFNFFALYGYAIFKMAAWLQFFFVPFIAYGLARFVAERRLHRFDFWLAAILGGFTVAMNAIATVDFGVKSLGDDTRRGAIVNSYGIGGNRDYTQLETELARIVPRGSVVGIAMPDYIANLWTSYYVQRAGMKASLVSHDDFPDEDAVLPDVVTGRVVNSAGTVLAYQPKYYAPDPPYLLLGGAANLNREITDAAQVPALWSNGSFLLVDSAHARDLLVTARGFYRLEYFDRERYPWWWPDRMRWTAEGGELLLIHASDPREPRRLSFVAVAGSRRGMPRHLEVFLNGKKFDEVTIHGAARVLSKPFTPTGGIDKIVVRARERVELQPRNFGLWNRHIAIDQRHLNLLVTQVRAAREGVAQEAVGAASLGVKDLIDRSREFDGVSLDGWIAPAARIVLPVKGISRANLRVDVPAWADYRYPVRVTVSVNGVATTRELAAPGAHELQSNVAADGGLLELRLESDQSADVPGTGPASFRILSLALE